MTENQRRGVDLYAPFNFVSPHSCLRNHCLLTLRIGIIGQGRYVGRGHPTNQQFREKFLAEKLKLLMPRNKRTSSKRLTLEYKDRFRQLEKS